MKRTPHVALGAMIKDACTSQVPDATHSYLIWSWRDGSGKTERRTQTRSALFVLILVKQLNSESSLWVSSVDPLYTPHRLCVVNK
jgi:hypothetical protein